MTKALKNTMIRVIKRRLSDGEDLETIFADYPKLTDAEKAEISKAIEVN